MEQVASDTMKTSKSLFASKDVKTFYSQNHGITNNMPKGNVVNMCSSYHVKLNEIKVSQHHGISSNVRAVKRKYEADNNDSKRKYKAGSNTANDGNFKELPVTDRQNNSTVNTNINHLSGNGSNSVQTIRSATDPLLTPLVTNKTHSSTKLKSGSLSSMKNIYYHDPTFWTTNLYGKKKMSCSKPAQLTNISKKAVTTKSNNIYQPSPSTVTSSSSSLTYTNSNLVNKDTMAYKLKNENSCGDLSTFVSKTDRNCEISLKSDDEKELYSVKESSTSEPYNNSKRKADNLVTCTNLPSTTQKFPNPPCNYTSSETMPVTCSNLPSTPHSIPGSVQVCNNTPSNSAPIQLSVEDCDGKLVNSAASTCSTTSSVLCNQLNKMTQDPSVANILSDSAESSENVLDCSLSSANTSLEDDIFEKTDKLTSDKLKNTENSNKKSKNKSDTKKTGNLNKCNSILNYFGKVNSTKKKIPVTSDDKLKSAEVVNTKDKKKGVLTVR